MSKNKLKITQSGDVLTVKFYNTDIVKIENRKVTLNTDGFKTKLTKSNINRVLNQYNIPLIVFKHQDKWWVSDLQKSNFKEFEDNKTYYY